jgi:predicted membrane chloride channel (bestrophin family)
VGCREGFLSKGVSVALWLLLFRCGKALEVFWVSREFWGLS